MDYSYKAEREQTSDDETSRTSKLKSKGRAGACKCSVQSRCVRGCPCSVAAMACTEACHGGKTSVKCDRCLVVSEVRSLCVEVEPELREGGDDGDEVTSVALSAACEDWAL